MKYRTDVILASSWVVPKPVPASQVDVGLEHFLFAWVSAVLTRLIATFHHWVVKCIYGNEFCSSMLHCFNCCWTVPSVDIHVSMMYPFLPPLIFPHPSCSCDLRWSRHSLQWTERALWPELWDRGDLHMWWGLWVGGQSAQNLWSERGVVWRAATVQEYVCVICNNDTCTLIYIYICT